MQKRNRGEADQYYVEGSHAGIVDKEVFDKVQEIINGRKVKYQTDAEVTKYPLTSKMHCTECGAFFIRKKTNGCISWVCTNHGISKDRCPTHYIREIRIYDAFIAMINKLRFSRERILEGTLRRLDDAIRRYRLNNAEAYEISKQISEINAKLLMLEQLHQKQYIAKNLVKAGLADRCQVGISYAIGKAEPLAVSVESFGTSNLSDEELAEIVTKVFDLRPAAIIERFDLKKPIYKKTSAYGHFNSADFPWEAENAIQDILTAEKKRNSGIF